MILTPADYEFATYCWIGLGIVAFISLLFLRAPYGRHGRPGWGAKISARVGWIIMESIPVILFSVLLYFGSNREPIVILFWAMWTAHYINRAWAWPTRAKITGKTIPISIVIIASTFNSVNTWLNGNWIFEMSSQYDNSWFVEPQFIIGLIIFISGMILNIKSDDILFSLRDDGTTGYKIPYGGAFEKVSCPNYLGEILEWIGWAIATWSLAGLAFAIWTFCNLAPRALSHHKWYKENFNDYPSNRKALIPWVW